MKKLGFGLMRLPLNDPKNEGDVDLAATNEMIDLFMAKGFTYFDTAWMYHKFESEHVARKCLVERYPRNAYTLTDKLRIAFVEEAGGLENMFATQLKKTGVTYFDYYLLHGIDDACAEKYEAYDCFNFIREKKRQGLTKHIGFSFHGTPALLERLLNENPDMDLVQLQINYLDWESPSIRAKECYEICTKHGIKVAVMEPNKGGTLANVPPSVKTLFQAYDPKASDASWAIRFVASLPNVMVVLSGMSNLFQVEDNLSFMADFKPLNEEESAIIQKATALINENIKIPCTGCSYCVEGCPMNIPIPQYFSLYNADHQEVAYDVFTPKMTYMQTYVPVYGSAGQCVACGQCESVCPQHLPIIKWMEKVAEHMGI